MRRNEKAELLLSSQQGEPMPTQSGTGLVENHLGNIADFYRSQKPPFSNSRLVKG